MTNVSGLEFANTVKTINRRIDGEFIIFNPEFKQKFDLLKKYDQALMGIIEETNLEKFDRVITRVLNSILGSNFRCYVYDLCAKAFHVSALRLEQLCATTCRMIIMLRLQQLWKHLTEYQSIGAKIARDIFGNDARYYYCVKSINMFA